MDRLNGGFDGSESGHDDDRQRRIFFMHDPRHVQSAHSRHAYIDDQQVVRFAVQARQSGVPRRHLVDAKAVGFKSFGKQLATDFVIIRDQDVGAHGFPHSSAKPRVARRPADKCSQWYPVRLHLRY